MTSQVACRVTSMSSSGFISLVPSLVLQFPVKKMFKQMLRPGLFVKCDIRVVLRVQNIIIHLPTKGTLLVPVLNVGRDS